MRTKIDYGIDLGTTNSAIARMENGKPVILKSDVQMDTLPSCISVTPRKVIMHGLSAIGLYRKEKLLSIETFEKMSSGELDGTSAFMQGQLKVDGDIIAAKRNINALEADMNNTITVPFNPAVYINAKRELAAAKEDLAELEALKTEYEKMISSGYDNIIYLESSNALGNDFEGTVDAVHFTDLGFKRYSNFLIEKFKEYDLLND